MTIAAIEPEVAGVQLVAVRHRLLGTVADIRESGRTVIPESPNYTAAKHDQTQPDD
jgi:hypothetical protein